MDWIDYLTEHAPHVQEQDWYNFAAICQRPEYLLRRFAKYLDWDVVLKYQKNLSEQFIREYMCYVEKRKNILFKYHNNLSEDFKRELGYDTKRT